MERLFVSILWILIGLVNCYAQGPCNAYVQSTRTASVTISSSTSIFYDGQAIPLGSRIVAIDEDGNCASDIITWTGNATTILVNGEDLTTEGFKDGEQIKFVFSLNDSCYIKTDAIIYNTFMSPTAGDFEENESFDLIFLSFEEIFELQIVDLIQNSCDSLNGGFSLEVSGGFGPFSYQWEHDSLLVDSIAMNLSEGDYSVTVSDTYGCPLIVEGTIITSGMPIEFEFLIDSTQAVCDTLVLSNNLPCSNCFYSWSNGVFTEFNQINMPGEYSVEVSNGECIVKDTLEVIFAEDPIVMASISDAQVCPGDTIELLASGAINYLWESSGEIINPLDSNTVMVVTNDAFIQLTADNVCKEIIRTFDVSVFSLPKAGEAQCVALNNNGIQLNADDAESYFWELNDDGPVSDDQIQNPTANPMVSTTYYVNFLDSNGCESRDSINVEVIEDIIAATPLYNIITPNNDGKNDVLYFDKLEISSGTELTVFNRWGKVVYNKVGYNNDWGGMSNGSLLPAGSYHYVLNINGTLLKSNLTIVYE